MHDAVHAEWGRPLSSIAETTVLLLQEHKHKMLPEHCQLQEAVLTRLLDCTA